MCGSHDHILPDCPQASAARSDRGAQQSLANYFALREVTFDENLDDDDLPEQQIDTPADRGIDDITDTMADEDIVTEDPDFC
jgi:hypothetical protein